MSNFAVKKEFLVEDEVTITRTFAANDSAFESGTSSWNSSGFTVPANCLILAIRGTYVSSAQPTFQTGAGIWSNAVPDLTWSTFSVEADGDIGFTAAGAFHWAENTTGATIQLSYDSGSTSLIGDHVIVYYYTASDGSIPRVVANTTGKTAATSGAFGIDLGVAPLLSSHLVGMYVREANDWGIPGVLAGGTGWTELANTYNTPDPVEGDHGTFHIQTRTNTASSNVFWDDVANSHPTIGFDGNGMFLAVEVKIGVRRVTLSANEINIDSSLFIDSGTVKIVPNDRLPIRSIRGTDTAQVAPDEGGLDIDHARPQFANKDILYQPGFELLNSGTVSNVATLDIITYPYAGEYKDLVFQLNYFEPHDDAVTFLMRFSTDRGVTFDVGGSDYRDAVGETWPTTSGGTWGSSATESLAFTVVTLGNDDDRGASVLMWLYGPFDCVTESRPCYYTYTGNVYTGADPPEIRSCFGMGRRQSNSNIDAVRVYMSAANITAGTWSLYGTKVY